VAHRVVLFKDRPRPVQILLGGVVPALLGALAGFLVGVSAGGYWAVSIVAAIGGFLAGFEHRDGWGGADRGMVGGLIYSTTLVLVHWATGKEAKVSLGSSRVVFVIFLTIIGILLGAAGGRIARFQRERAGIYITDEHLAEDREAQQT
jgi:ABC-type Na+ efflux pump permease subunit